MGMSFHVSNNTSCASGISARYDYRRISSSLTSVHFSKRCSSAEVKERPVRVSAKHAREKIKRALSQ